MIIKKAELIFIVTLFAVVFTSLTYIFPPKYAQLWLSLEIIIIPTMYLVGYEFMLHKQKKKFDYHYLLLNKKLDKLEKENTKLKTFKKENF